jgi:hypothetical protein
MSVANTEIIRHRLQKELDSIQKAAAGSSGAQRTAFETLARVFRQRLAEVPFERPVPPPRVQDVLPPAHQHAMQ